MTIKIKVIYSLKHPVKRKKRLAVQWEKICLSQISDKGFLSGIYKESLKLKSKLNMYKPTTGKGLVFRIYKVPSILNTK